MAEPTRRHQEELEITETTVLPDSTCTDVTKGSAVDWDGPNDTGMPINWPKHRKLVIICVITASRVMTSFASSMMSPALLQIKIDFEGPPETLLIFTVSIYVLGSGVGPMVFAPLSEVYGRNKIYHIGNTLYTLFTVGCALAPNISSLLAFRLLAGMAGGVPVTLAGGTVSDIIPRERRGLIQSIFGATILLAPTLAPTVGGFLAETVGWRWIFWVMTIFSGVTTILGFTLLQETYPPILLQRKASRLRQQTGNKLLNARGMENTSLSHKLRHAIRRPVALLFRSPVLILGSLYLALVYGTTYLLLTSILLVFHDVYGWDEWSVGLAPLGVGVGSLLGIFVTGRYSDRIYVRRKERSGGESSPECRLFFLFPAAITLPAGLIVYGWSAQFHTHWIVPIIGTGIFAMGMIFAFDSIHSYLIDTFTIYAASALAATTLVRSPAGGFLPLGGPGLYTALGHGWGNSLLGVLAALFGTASLGLWRYGRQMRERYWLELN